MMKREIEIPDLPKGWKAVAYRIPRLGEHYLYRGAIHSRELGGEYLIIEKIKPRRIVLEETEEKYLGNQVLNIFGIPICIMTSRKWRAVKEGE